MAVSLVRFAHEGRLQFGRLLSAAPFCPDDQLEVELMCDAATTAALLAALDSPANCISSGVRVKIEARQLVSPLTTDATLVCQGLNYRDHAQESGHHSRKANLLFAKASSSLSGPYDDIVRPEGVELLDYEAEIGIVLRKALSAASTVDASNIGDYVAAVTLCNDVSARDVMFGSSFLQWFQGKSYRTFCPTGPVLYWMEPGEVAGILDALSFSLEYRGETRQSAISAQQVYKAPETLAQVAAIMDLKAGDMILTGTPGGVLAQATPALARVLATNLFDDATRRAEFVTEAKRNDPFLQPGDELTLNLRDDANGVDLGGQYCRIA
jgi:2-keto-4-pentenoate hydratase/2-oxohepta-3-ene-1,7-dioic acid hydratase in catechol pathway